MRGIGLAVRHEYAMHGQQGNGREPTCGDYGWKENCERVAWTLGRLEGVEHIQKQQPGLVGVEQCHDLWSGGWAVGT